MAYYSYSSIQRVVTLLCLISSLPIVNSSNSSLSIPIKKFCQRPPNFPTKISLTRQTFRNWANDLLVRNLWTVEPESVNDLLRLVNWAASNEYTIRASGYMHNWSPLTVTKTTSCSKTKVILVKTTSWLTDIQMISNDTVKVQTGVTLETLLTILEENGAGILASPAPGDITIGGILAIGGHGTGIPALGEKLQQGFTYGSLSNLVVALTAIVWDPVEGQYMTREFHRSESDTKVFLTNLGRTFLIDVTLRVGQNYNLRCQSRIDIPASELFAMPGSNIRTMESFLDQSGRIEAIWFPSTSYPWLKIWTVRPNKPKNSRVTSSPFNYPFSDNIPPNLARKIAQIASSANNLATSMLGVFMYKVAKAGLTMTDTRDLWGTSKNLLLYIKPTTLRLSEYGVTVITARSNVQNVIHSSVKMYNSKLEAYKSRNEYPANGPLEIRVTGLDLPEDVGIPHAESPTLSPVKPVPGRPDLDTAVWFSSLSFPGTPYANEFYTELESYFLFTLNDGVNAVVRPEWSKGWGYTAKSPYTNMTVIREVIPAVFGRDSFNWTVNKLNQYDPSHVFSNEFLETIMN